METLTKKAVQIFAVDAGLIVRIVENGRATNQTFLLEENARAYAEGQRIRLKLKTYEFLPINERV